MIPNNTIPLTNPTRPVRRSTVRPIGGTIDGDGSASELEPEQQCRASAIFSHAAPRPHSTSTVVDLKNDGSSLRLSERHRRSGNRSALSRISVTVATAIILGGCLDPGSSAPQETGAGQAPAVLPPSTPNTPPSISGVPTTTAMIGNSWAFTPNANDPDGDPLSFDIENKPDWMNFDNSVGTLSGVPLLGNEGSYPGIVISTSDGKAISALPAFTLTVQNASSSANRPPSISGSPSPSVLAGNQFSFRPSASDPDGDDLTFGIANRPSWANFNNNNGRLYGTPAVDDAGVYGNIVISVSDGEASVSMPPLTIEVIAPAPSNRAPTISGTPSSAVTVAQSYSFRPSASDPDGDDLTFSIANQPAWTSFNNSTGRLNGTPTVSDVGTYPGIRISVSDGELSASLPTFSIVVAEEANNPPQISGTPSTQATVGQAYSFRPNASDPDGDDLTFSIVNQPAWTSFNNSTGRLNGTPGDGDVGSYPGIRISVSDGELSDSLPTFSIVVAEEANNPPQISGTPSTQATVGQAYSFQPNASDPDGDDLTFAIVNQPAWMSFNNATGRLSGTPGTNDVGIHGDIHISVSDGDLSDELPSFSIDVQEEENNPPQISGSPSTQATVGQAYSFRPNASDPDGDVLTFSITSQPSWASFNSSTGRLSGTPQQGDERIYDNIVISASDGILESTLAPFSIEVLPAASATGSVTLTWTPPTQNTDGSPLTDLVAYKFYYGLAQGNYPNEIRIDNPGISSFVIDDLAPNTYYFVTTVINSSEVESAFSNVASTTVTGN